MSRTLDSIDLRKLSKDLSLVLLAHLERRQNFRTPDCEEIRQDFEETIYSNLIRLEESLSE